jgi:hypothetical protein
VGGYKLRSLPQKCNVFYVATTGMAQKWEIKIRIIRHPVCFVAANNPTIHNLTYVLNLQHFAHDHFKSNVIIDQSKFTLNTHRHPDKSVNNCCTVQEFKLSSTHCHVATSRLLQVFLVIMLVPGMFDKLDDNRKMTVTLWCYWSCLFKLIATKLPSITLIFVEYTRSVNC